MLALLSPTLASNQVPAPAAGVKTLLTASAVLLMIFCNATTEAFELHTLLMMMISTDVQPDKMQAAQVKHAMTDHKSA